MGLVTPHKIQALQRKLYLKAKQDRATETAQALRMNLVREPDAGNPHVRFDEREVETEHGTASEAPTTERVGNGWAFSKPPRHTSTLHAALVKST